MKKTITLTTLFIFFITAISCGGSSSSSNNNSGGASGNITETSNDEAQVYWAVAEGFKQAMTQIFSVQGTDTESAQTAMSLANSTACPGGGDTTSDFDQAFSSEIGSKITGTIAFNNCAVEVSLTNPEDSENTCTYNATMNGSINCEISRQEDSSGTYTFIDCQTTESCSGITVVINGTTYQHGGSSATRINDNDTGVPESTGSFCVDNKTYETNTMIQTELTEC